MTKNEILAEYDKQAPCFTRLTKLIERKLKKLRGWAEKDGIRILTVTARKDGVKSRESVEKKIDDRSYTHFTQLTDLSGLKIIFYYEDDIDPFVREVRKNFKVKEDRTKDQESGYQSRHLTVSLEKNQLTKKNSDLVGLPCEIQLVSVLKHGWDQVSHDVTYKDREGLENFDQYAFNELKKDFKTLADQLYDIDIKFQALRDRAKLMREAKTALSDEFLHELSLLENYDSIVKSLSVLSECLSHFHYKADKNVCDLLASLVDKDDLPVQKKEDPFWGTFYGKNYEDALEKIIENAVKMRFHFPIEVFQILLKISEKLPPKSKVLLKAVETLFKHETYIFIDEDGKETRKISYRRQKLLLEEMNKWSVKTCEQKIDILLKACDEIFDAELQIITANSYESYNFSSGYVMANDELKEVRHETFNLLARIFSEVGDVDRLKVLDCLENSTGRPSNYDDKLMALLMEDVDIFINFLNEKATPDLNPRVLLSFEHSLVSLLHQYPELENAKELLQRIRSFEQYSKYRALVGREHLYSMMQDPSIKEDLDPDFDQLIEDFKEEKVEDILSNLNYIVETYEMTRDDWSFHYFFEFLYKFAKKEPAIAHALINKIEEAPESNRQFMTYFYSKLLRGLKASDPINFRQWEKENLEKKTKESILLHVNTLDNNLNEEEAQKLLDIVTAKNGFEFVTDLPDEDQGTISNYCIHAAIRLGSEVQDTVKSIIIEGLKLKGIDKRKAAILLDHFWVFEYKFEGWSKGELKAIQNLLVQIEDVQQHHVQKVLSRIFHVNPEAGIEIFDLRHAEYAKKPREMRYMVTPIDFDHELRTVLEENEAVLGKSLMKRYFSKKGHFHYIAELLTKICKDGTLKTELLNQVNAGKVGEVIDLMVEIGLSQGTIDVALDIINREDGEKWERRLKNFVMSGSAGGSGEFAIENAYRRRLEYFNSTAQRHESLSSKQKAYILNIQEMLQANIDSSHTSAIEDIKARKKDFEV